MKTMCEYTILHFQEITIWEENFQNNISIKLVYKNLKTQIALKLTTMKLSFSVIYSHLRKNLKIFNIYNYLCN